MKNINKIMIFGRPGSGKSTFAFEFSKTLNPPLHHLDKYFFEANWIERDYQEFLCIQQSLIDNDRWIIDGNSTKSLEMRYSKADLVLYFIYPRWICYFRIIKRLFYKNKDIDDRAHNCRETVNLGLIKYMWSFEDRVERQIHTLREAYPNVIFIEIKNDQELKKLKYQLL